MTDKITIPSYDPNAALTNPVRSLGGVSKMGVATPDVDYGVYATWLYVSVSGANLFVKLWDGTLANFKNMPVGLYPIHSLAVTGSSSFPNAMLWGV